MKFKTVIFAFWIVLLTAGGSYAVEDICYHCHNSYLLEKDQSCTIWIEHGHPVYVKPSRKVQVPSELPLNDQGQISCNTCHVVYGDRPKDSPDKDPRAFSQKIYLRQKNIDSSLCKMCHTMQASAQLRPETQEPQYDFVVDESFNTEEGIKQEGLKIKFNHPVDVTSMRIPRQLSISGGGDKSEKDLLICETCHRVHQAKGKPLLALNNERGLLCGSCHGAMYAKDRIDSAQKGTHPVNVKPSIAVLSPDMIIRGGKKNSYGEIVCLTCHAVHAAATPKTLLLKENIQSSLCVECHKREKQSLANTKHDINKLYPETQNILQQNPVQSGMCGVCHLAHQGTGPKMWARPLEKKEETITNLCKSCHESGKMAGNRLIGIHTHPVDASLDKLKNNALRYSWLPLYSDEGVIEAKGVMTCATCHNVHRWEPDYEIASADALIMEGDVTNSFLRMKDTNSKLCIYCHEKQKLIEYTVHDPRTALYSQGGVIPNRVDTNKSPVDSPNSGICSTCHTPHQAHSRRLWAREIGPGTDPITRICSSCHSDGFIASEKQVGKITHPNNVTFSKPFPIELPLYNEQLAKVEKGKILCITCHNIHQWDPDVLKPGEGSKEEGTPGDSFLRIAANSREKSLCDDCHIDQQWVKGTDHDLTITAPDETDDTGRTPRQTGICLPCHAIHNAPNQLALWRPAFGPGKDKITAMCNSCHYTDKIAQAKMLTPNSHPVGISTFSILDSVKSTSLPIYDDDYKQIKKPREKLAPIFFSEDLDSKAKVESIKMYFRVLRSNYLYLRKNIPALRKNIEKLMSKIKIKQGSVDQQKIERDIIQKKIDDSIDQYKKLEFNLTLLRTKKRLLEKLSPISGTGKGSSARSLEKLNKKIEEMESNYKKTEKHFNNLYKEIKEIRKKYWKKLDWIDSAQVKTDRMKKKYIQLIDRYKVTKKELENIITKVKGKKRPKKVNMSELDKLDLIFSDGSLVDNLTKGDLVRKLFDFRQKYFDMVKKVEGLKKKTEKILQSPSNKDKTAETFLPQEKTPAQIARENLDLDYHIANSFDDSDVEALEELGQGFQGKMFCTTCHDPHRWNPRKNAFGPGKPEEGGNGDSFLRLANDLGSALCINCHKKMEVVEGTEHDLRLSAPSETNHLGQNTETSGVCGSCHLVHNAAIPHMLWSKTVSPDKNKDIISSLCKGCHNRDGCASAKGVGENTHPINIILRKPEELESERETRAKYKMIKKRRKKTRKKAKNTAGKKQKKLEKKETEKVADELEIEKISVYPLFTFDGNRDDKNGKIFCSTCHNVHQWKPGEKEKGPQISLEGTAANSFLRDDNFNRPTLCLNCHPEKSSVIGTKHDLAITAPEEKNIRGQKAQDSGTCGTCHLVHNATNKYNLWARSFGPNILPEWDQRLALEDDKTVQTCTACHSPKGIASNSIPEAGLHYNQLYIIQKEVKNFLRYPTFPYFNYVFDVIRKRLGIQEIYQAGAKPKFPLYNTQGQIVPSGNIACSTCHDIHTWSTQEAKNKNIGDFTSSFLRPDAAAGLCSDCHGYDAIYLFAYYHKSRGGKVEQVSTNNPHWKNAPVNGSCKDCHNNKKVGIEKHPINVPLIAKRKKIKLPDLTENFPLTDGKLDCRTCHNQEIQKQLSLRTSNPYFLQGEFYTLYWRNEVRKRTVAMVRKSREEGASGFGGIGMMGLKRSNSQNNPPHQQSLPGFSSPFGTNTQPSQQKEIQTPSQGRGTTAGPRRSRPNMPSPGENKSTPSISPSSHLDRSSLFEHGYLYYYNWRKLIFSPWNLLFDTLRNAVEKIKAPVAGIFRGIRYFRNLLSAATYRTWMIDWNDSASVTSVSSREVSSSDDNASSEEWNESSNQVRLYAQVRGEWNPYSRRSYQSPYFQEKGQQGKPKAGKVKRPKKPPESEIDKKSENDETIEDDMDISFKKVLGGRRISPAVPEEDTEKETEHKGKYRVGPRRDMIPRVTEEMLRARRKKWAKLKKKKKKKEIIPKTFVKVTPPTALDLLVWTTDESTLFGPNRYSLCYECHIMERYRQFSPHVNQIDKDGNLNHDMCILCHKRIPNRKTVDPSEFYLRAPMEQYCIGCHIGMTESHPGGKTHYGLSIPSIYRKRIATLISSSILFIPTKDNKLVCSSCHNPHQKGVILRKMAKRGADEKGRMRFFGYETCNACHKGITTPTGSGSPF